MGGGVREEKKGVGEEGERRRKQSLKGLAGGEGEFASKHV